MHLEDQRAVARHISQQLWFFIIQEMFKKIFLCQSVKELTLMIQVKRYCIIFQIIKFIVLLV
jgi:hypothetical protein